MVWELSLNKALNIPGASPCTYNKVVTIPANTLNDPAPANLLLLFSNTVHTLATQATF